MVVLERGVDGITVWVSMDDVLLFDPSSTDSNDAPVNKRLVCFHKSSHKIIPAPCTSMVADKV